MRVVSGKYKSKFIQAPKNLPVRPTTDFAKEALFNVLNNMYYFDEISVLDLFCGTGNISYEFGSRGCKDITSVDQNVSCIRFVDHMSKEMELGIISFQAEVESFLSKSKRKFDLIFMDPPYDYANYEQVVTLVFSNQLLTERGILVLEHDSKSEFSQFKELIKTRKYGKVQFSFFEYI